MEHHHGGSNASLVPPWKAVGSPRAIVLFALLMLLPTLLPSTCLVEATPILQTSSAHSADDDEIVVNGGFERGDLGGWRNASTEYPGSDYAISEDKEFEGPGSLKMTAPGNPPYKAFVWQQWRPGEGFEEMPEKDVELMRDYSLSFAVFFEESPGDVELVVMLNLYYHNVGRGGRTGGGEITLIDYVVGTGERPTVPYHRQIGSMDWGEATKYGSIAVVPIQRCEFGRWYQFTVHPLRDLKESHVDLVELASHGLAYSGALVMLLSSSPDAAAYVDAVSFWPPENESTISLDITPSSPLLIDGAYAQPVRISGSVQPTPGEGEKVLLRHRTGHEDEASWHFIEAVETDAAGRFEATWSPPTLPVDNGFYVRASWDDVDDYAVATGSFTLNSIGALFVGLVAAVGLGLLYYGRNNPLLSDVLSLRLDRRMLGSVLVYGLASGAITGYTNVLPYDFLRNLTVTTAGSMTGLTSVALTVMLFVILYVTWKKVDLRQDYKDVGASLIIGVVTGTYVGNVLGLVLNPVGLGWTSSLWRAAESLASQGTWTLFVSSLAVSLAYLRNSEI